MSLSMAVGSAARILILVAFIPLGSVSEAVLGSTLVGAFFALLVPLPLIWSVLRTPSDGIQARRIAWF